MNTTRRDFLKLATGSAALVMLPPTTTWAESSTRGGKISLGHSLYGMQTVPLKEAVAHCARIGFRNIELVLDPNSPADPKQLNADARRELREQIAGLKMEVSALMRNLRLTGGPLNPAENLEAIKEAAQFAHDVAADTPPPIETVLGGKPEEWETNKSEMVDRLGEWMRTAEAAEIGLLIKAHRMMAVDTPEKLLWLLEQVPSSKLGVTYDFSHFEPQGLSLKDTWSALQARTRFVHVKDTKVEGDKVSFLLPGEGAVDYVAFFQLLDRTGYDGPVVAEVSSMIFRQAGYDPVQAAEKCYRVLARAMEAAGVPRG